MYNGLREVGGDYNTIYPPEAIGGDYTVMMVCKGYQNSSSMSKMVLRLDNRFYFANAFHLTDLIIAKVLFRTATTLD